MLLKLPALPDGFALTASTAAPPEGPLDQTSDELTVDDGSVVDPYYQTDDAVNAWYADTNFWVLVAFLIVIGILVWRGVPKMLTAALDKRAEGIRTQLDEARSLREEAQRTLADYQKRQREAEDEAAAIVDQAKADAKAMREQARLDIDAQLRRRREAAENRIKRAEQQAVADVRNQAADLAIRAARDILAKQDKAALTDRAIADVGARLG